MESIEHFLAHAIQLEFEAARRYEELRAFMRTAGNKEAEAFFAQMAEYARTHLQDAMRRGGFRDIPKLSPDQWLWPEGVSPEQAAWAGLDAMIDEASAYRLALDGEERSHLFYSAIASSTQDPEIRRMAKEFATEEAEHVRELEALMARKAA